MLVNQRNLLLGVPKCGSRSAGLFLAGDMVSREKPHPFYSEIEGEFDNVYAFWRNPVDRFKSAIKFLNETDDDGVVYDARVMLDKLIAGSTPIVLLKPQSEWYRNVPNLTLLHFDQFEANMHFLEGIFGRRFEEQTEVPRTHQTTSTLELDADLEQAVREYYSEDYTYESLCRQ